MDYETKFRTPYDACDWPDDPNLVLWHHQWGRCGWLCPYCTRVRDEFGDGPKDTLPTRLG